MADLKNGILDIFCGVHSRENRRVSFQEVARLRLFPEWYKFKVELSSKQQVATPPANGKRDCKAD